MEGRGHMGGQEGRRHGGGLTEKNGRKGTRKEEGEGKGPTGVGGQWRQAGGKRWRSSG
jgi:hypothetical protein